MGQRGTAETEATYPLSLSANLTPNDPAPIRAGLKWRVFEERAQNDGSRKLLAESDEAQPHFNLPSGGYMVHAAYGLAGATRLARVNGGPAAERLTLNAGALKVLGLLGDAPAPPQRLSIAVYVPARGNPEGKLVLEKGKANDLIILPEGNYHIVSTLYDVSSTGSAQATLGVFRRAR
jgi:hypothetical protein